MKLPSTMTLRMAATGLSAALLMTLSSSAADAPSAAQLAAGLSDLRQDGSTFVRLRMDIEQPAGTKKVGMQVQIKSRRTKSSTELLYQVLWPKERKGESVLLRKTGDGAAKGFVFVPGGTAKPIEGAQMKGGLFGGDLTYEDALENFFAWDQQAIVGTEQVGRVSCQILESKPGKGRSSYTSVRSWVDTRRMVPLRVDKFVGSQVVRTIVTNDVASTEKNTHLPANLTVRGAGNESATTLDGSKIKFDMAYADRDFTPEAMAELTVPRGGGTE